MKTRKLQLTGGIIRSGLLLSLMILLVKCVGPRGPRGLDGDDGLDGLDGDVFAYSVIYDVEALDWAGNENGYFATLSVPEIDDDIYYNGAVLVYWLNESNPKNFTILPYSYMNVDGLTTVLACDIYVGSIDLFFQEIENGLPATFAPVDLWSFKIVIIEGIPLATVKSMVDIKDYNAVTRTFKPDINKKILPVF